MTELTSYWHLIRSSLGYSCVTEGGWRKGGIPRQ